MEQEIYVGTSGYSYPEWKGIFYPPDVASKDYLRFYSARFPTTEINNTFYRFPTESASEGWNSQVPPGFRFSIKLTQKITHAKKLDEVSDEMSWFQKGIGPLRGRLGAVLVQLPPYFRQDLPLLKDFVSSYGTLLPLAFEFRHASWQSDETYRVLQDAKACLVIAETDQTPAERTVTANQLYLRLRKSAYEEGELEAWAEWIQATGKPAYVYLKHDRQAPMLAARLTELLAYGSSRSR
jgi:uncharacterized protein YecE (DUF72 family)